jgi:hypothetical protein
VESLLSGHSRIQPTLKRSFILTIQSLAVSSQREILTGLQSETLTVIFQFTTFVPMTTHQLLPVRITTGSILTSFGSFSG